MEHNITSLVLTSLGSTTDEDWLTDTEYKALCELFHQFNAAFSYLPDYIKSAYYARLYQR